MGCSDHFRMLSPNRRASSPRKVNGAAAAITNAANGNGGASKAIARAWPTLSRTKVQCEACGMWLREKRVIEEREDTPPEEETSMWNRLRDLTRRWQK